MLYLCEISEESRKLKHSGHVFHDALKYAENGETTFRIECEDGEDYGLTYINNDQYLHSCKTFPAGLIDLEQPLFPEYFDYDEYDGDSLYLKIFDTYTGVYLKDLNEYTVAIGRALLKFTDKKVFISDGRFLIFLDPSENLSLLSHEDEIEGGRIMTVVREFVMEELQGRYDLVDSIELFHNVFCHQFLAYLKTIPLRGVVVTVPKTEGIGSILNFCMRMKYICEKYGIEMVVKPNSTRYEDELLNRYFKLPIKNLGLKKAAGTLPKYSRMNNLYQNEDGEYYVDIFPTTAFTHEYYQTHPEFLEAADNTLTLDVLSDRFRGELEEYRTAVFQNRRVLGVLVRGSDYIVFNMPDQPLGTEELFPIVKKVKEEGNYDAIFLATEDQDYYRAFVEAFPNNLIVISQNRISKEELKDYILISELEKARSREENNSGLIEDNMVNYFYALYLLSKCDGFLATPMCGGVAMVRSFNKGKFDCFQVVQAPKSSENMPEEKA